MRLVVAVVDPALVEAVRQALTEIQVTRLTICDAHGYAAPPGHAIRQLAVLEIAVNDDFLARTLERLAAVLAASDGSADSLLVLPVEDVVEIHRDVRGPEAV